jgi:YD repeat-containing protein
MPDLSVIRPGYNEANLLETLEVRLRGEATPDGQPVWTPFVRDIDYNAKGQRILIEYGNGVTTTYDYDPLTFRLRRLFTKRGARFPQVCAEELSEAEIRQRNCPKPERPCKALQNLHYTYDPVGNITHIRDEAQQTVYFRNQCVEPNAAYTYDALYRLIKAMGREHLGQTNNRAKPAHTTRLEQRYPNEPVPPR